MRRTSLVAFAGVSAALLALTSAAPALAADGDIVLIDRETVQAYLTPTGEVKVARLYDQLTATGNGEVTVRNPVSTDGLRNLDKLGGVEVEDGAAVSEISVDGEKRLRTVSSFPEEDLPVTITPTYELDGEVYEDPEDLVGKSGRLKVTYTVENVTAEPQTITVQDGKGNPVERQVDVPLPLVGSLVTVLPDNFYSVQSDQATVTADGRGGTRTTFTMTLLPPIGALKTDLVYQARVEDIVIPRATVSVAVVQPLKYPSLATAAESYAGGAETGATLTAGAELIDENLLKLRDGAGELLGGLLQLRDGAQQLQAGLAEEAAPGAHLLANGAGEAAVGAGELAAGLQSARTGSGDLADGLGTLADGNRTLANGFRNPTGGADLISGSQDLAAGLGLISGGLAQLSSVEGLPKAYAGLQTLRYGIDHPIGAGGAADPGGLLQALQQIAAGLSNSGCNPANPTDPKNPCGVKETLAALDSGLTTIKGGLQQVGGGLSNPACSLADPTNATNPCGVREIVNAVQDGMAASLAAGSSIDQLAGGAQAAYFFAGCSATPPPATPVGLPGDGSHPTMPECDYIERVYHGINTTLRANTTQSEAGLSGVVSGLDTKLLPGVQQLIAGVTSAQTGLTAIRGGVDRLALGAAAARDGVAKQVLPGIDQLLAGLSSAVTGVNQLSAGAATAATGSGTLAEKIAEAGAGAEKLADGSLAAEVGSRQLADGLVDAAVGSGQLADGNRQIADGASELAAGLDTAADGSGQLATGLGQAAEGAPQIVDGAERLSVEGTSQLVQAGNETALDFGERYGVLQAMAQRTENGGLPFGAPEGATGAAAYSFELAAATNEGSKNLTRGALAIVAIGLGALLSTVVRGRLLGG